MRPPRGLLPPWDAQPTGKESRKHPAYLSGTHDSLMSVDVTKHLERAKKYLEKNKLQDAVEEYQAVLQAYPNHQESVQALGDLYTRLNEPTRAAQYYGMLFDRLSDIGDASKATALYARFLKGVQQSPERIMRFALLLQRQNKRDEAIECYTSAGEQFIAQQRDNEALACWEKIATLDPENPARHVKLGEVGERLSRGDVASRGFLRAGQIMLGNGELEMALEYFARAQRLAPSDRSVALLYADALLHKNEAKKAVKLLEPFPTAEADPNFLSVFGTALTDDGQFTRAREILEQLYKERPDNFDKLFDLADKLVAAGKDTDAVDVLSILKQRMFAGKRTNEFTAQMDRIADLHPRSTPLAEFCGRTYDELNRESKYFSVLTRLFDLYVEAGNFDAATNSLDRIVDIDPYDPHNHSRMDRLEGKVDPSYVRGVAARMGKSITGGGMQSSFGRESREAAEPSADSGGEGRERLALEDLLVQAEIFLQYSLHAKAVERLQKIAEMFPGEEENNPRVRNLYDLANWWPPASKKKAAPATVEAKPAVAAASQTGSFNAETLRDLGKVSEITRSIHRQATPKAVLAAAVNEIGNYLRVSRCLVVIGPPDQPPQLVSEFCLTGVEPSQPPSVAKLLTALAQVKPDSMGACTLTAAQQPALAEMGLDSALGVHLTDRETQNAAGMLVIGNAGGRKWKPNEGYFLQAVGDQVVIGVNHTKLRSLMRNLAVADEKTGLLGRGSYSDALLSESNRARQQSSPLALVILTLDRGPDLMKQQGEPQLDRHMEQIARTLQAAVRQNDLAVKYTSWSLAFILPDTKIADALLLAEKLRKVALNVQPPWNGSPVTISASVVEAVSRPDYESEDIVTDLINRAEFGLEEARKKGGDVILSL